MRIINACKALPEWAAHLDHWAREGNSANQLLLDMIVSSRAPSIATVKSTKLTNAWLAGDHLGATTLTAGAEKAR
jgi:hypothetical protein